VAKTYKSADSSLLRAIRNPDKRPYEINIDVPEITFEGVGEQPDFAHAYITVYPDKNVIELSH
jgi:NADPH-dependent 7-cyano-7-deazaguanine reductase QueF